MRNQPLPALRVVSFNEAAPALVGESAAFRSALNDLGAIAMSNDHALITGETGTGKDMCAKAIHILSGPRERPYVRVNCGCLPATLAESELFGHVAGAYTGATKAKKGLVQEAHGGTLFLNDIDSLPLPVQAALLEVLDCGECWATGSNTIERVDVRVIVATNADLGQRIADRLFRQDLYERLSGWLIALPPLRERGDDLKLLSEHFLKEHAAQRKETIKAVSAEVWEKLKNYGWPGNVRELRKVLQRAALVASGPAITAADIKLKSAGARAMPKLYDEFILDVGGEYLRNRMVEKQWNVSVVARDQRMSRNRLKRLLAAHQVKIRDESGTAPPKQ